MDNNIHEETVDGFGAEWTRFSQSDLDESEAGILFSSYFNVVPQNKINESSVVADFGALIFYFVHRLNYSYWLN